MNPAILMRLVKIVGYLGGLVVAITYGVSIGYLLKAETKQEKEGGIFLVILLGIFFAAALILLLLLHLFW